MIFQKENDSTWVPLTFLAYRRPQWPVGSHQCLSLHEAPRQDPQEVRPLGRLCSATWSSLWIQLSPKTSHWEVPHTWDIIWWVQYFNNEKDFKIFLYQIFAQCTVQIYLTWFALNSIYNSYGLKIIWSVTFASHMSG